MNIIKGIWQKLDWTLYPTTLISFLTLIGCGICYLYLPVQYAYENSYIENVQLVVLAGIAMVALTAKNNTYFFRFIALMCIILFLREINCGRVLFPIEGEANKFKKWDEIWDYGWLVRTGYGLIIASTVFYFLRNKLWKTLCFFWKQGGIPVFDAFFIPLGLFVQHLTEHMTQNMVLEECFETLFYVALFSVTYLYARGKRKISIQSK